MFCRCEIVQASDEFFGAEFTSQLCQFPLDGKSVGGELTVERVAMRAG
jgi:hypothetical protein